MILEYQQAIVSLSLDLTNPDAASRPVAVMLVGKADGWPVAAIACRRIHGTHDPVTNEILGDIPALLLRHLDRAFHPGAELPEVLHKLHMSLRNSLHVVGDSRGAGGQGE